MPTPEPRKVVVEVCVEVEIEISAAAEKLIAADRNEDGDWEQLAWMAVMAGRQDASNCDGWADLSPGMITMDLQNAETEIHD